MLGRRSKNKLSTSKFYRPFRLFTAPSPNSSLPQCRRATTKHITQCIATNSRPEISGFLHKGFSQITEEIVGKATHAACLKGWTRLCIFHTNTLINMYAKLGNLKYAEQVFDEMPERNGASWSNMISGYVRMGLNSDVLKLFIVMQNWGFELSAYRFIIPSLLTAVTRSGCMYFEGLQINALILKNGMIYDVFVGTSLLQLYGAYGLISDAQMLFEEMPDRNVVSWTSLMGICADVGLFKEVLSLYCRMRVEQKNCDRYMFATVISSCGALGDGILVQQVLVHVIVSGLLKDAFVANSIVSVFSSFGKLGLAMYVFDNVDKHDTTLWSSMIAAFAHNHLFEDSFRYFCLMRYSHGKVDENALSTVLSVCCSLDNSNLSRGIHGLVLKIGLGFNIRISNYLLKEYFNTGQYVDAQKLFHNLPERDLVSWNSMMAGYVLERKFLDALKLFRELLDTGNVANFITFATALSCCAKAESLGNGKSVHALVIASGFHENTIVGNALVTMYGKCGMTKEAKKVFQNMPGKDLVTWNALIGSFAENEETKNAMETFKAMRRSESPDYVTLIHVLESFCDPSYLRMYGMPLHAHILSTGYESNEYVTNSLISMYAKCGHLHSSNAIFCSSVGRTTSEHWNVMVSAMAHKGCWKEAFELLWDMQRFEVGFDEFTLSAALSASADSGILQQGQHLHCLAVKLSLDQNHFVANATMDMYGKCGDLDDLLELLPDPKRRSVSSWNVLISASARHGCFQKAKETFNEMTKCGAKPDHITFVAILTACSHGGLVDDGLAYFASMTSEFGVEVDTKHCVCIVDLLSRSGQLAEAEAFIEGMSMTPDDRVWQTLLAACRVHANLELGQKVGQRLLEARTY